MRESDDICDAKQEKITMITLRNTMDRIGGNLHEVEADLEYVVNGKSKDEEEKKSEDRPAPTLEGLQAQLTRLLNVAHTCQVLVNDLRA